MILPVHRTIRSALTRTLASQFSIPAAEQPSIVLEAPPSRALGDVAVPVAFELARRLRKAPRVIAQEIAAALGAVEGIRRVDAAPNGYLNFYLDRREAFSRWLSPAAGPVPSAAGKVIVEHTAINPNKAAHIGHLRNAALGDTLVRLLRFQGRQVEVQNYIDDTGVQVADVVVGFTDEIAHKRPIRRRPACLSRSRIVSSSVRHYRYRRPSERWQATCPQVGESSLFFLRLSSPIWRVFQ
jgi:arginyl-tRNA synthetase